MVNKIFIFEELSNPTILFGENDNNLKVIESELDVEIYPKSNQVKIIGDEYTVDTVAEILSILWDDVKKGKSIQGSDVKILIDSRHSKIEIPKDKYNLKEISVSKNGRVIKAKTLNQIRYISAIRGNDLTFGIGPAGTGKTYLAIAMGVNALIHEGKERLILTRPVVEAGESLGYLPGDLQQKINPYLRPLFDALYDMMSFEDVFKLKEKEIIEIAPLAYMRGRTLNNCVLILDEAQNTTIGQMKMLLTRLGHNSKTIITGDLTQIDLPRSTESGLHYANRVLQDVKGLEFVYFQKADIIRHPLVQRIIDAFEKEEQSEDKHSNKNVFSHKSNRK